MINVIAINKNYYQVNINKVLNVSSRSEYMFITFSQSESRRLFCVVLYQYSTIPEISERVIECT